MLPSPISWTKKILLILKSNLSPNQIAFAFALGVFAGLPPMGIHIIIPCTLALLVRCSFRAFLVSMGLFKLISLAAAPASFAIGRWLLDEGRGLDALWRWVLHLPVLAPMGYARYLLLGSLLLSALIAIPVFLLIRWLVVRYRRSFTEWVAGWRSSTWLRGKRGTGLARRFLAGGDAKYKTTRPPRGPFRYVRREMLVGLPVIYGIAYLLAAIVVPFFAGSVMTSTATWVVGSDVAIEESSFSLFTGRLTLTGFSVQDPQAPGENLLDVPALTIDAGMLPLLSKRVVFNSVSISDVGLHVVREADGTLNIDNASSGWNVEGYIEWATRYAKEVDWLGLLRKFFEHLAQARPLAPRTDPYAPYQGSRSFPAFRPPFAVQRLEIGRVNVSLEDRLDPGGLLPPIRLLEVEISNLAFPTHLRESPIIVRFHGQLGDDPESGFELSARFEEAESGSRHTYEFAMTRIDLPRLARLYATTLPVTILTGHVTLTGALTLAGSEADGEISLVLQGLALEGRPDQPLFGLPNATSDQVIDGINRYAAELPIVIGFPIGGARGAPTFEWEASLLDIARQGLLMLGRQELSRTIDDLGLRIDVLGGVASGPMDPDYEALRAQAEQAAIVLITQGAEGAIPGLPAQSAGEAEPTDDSSPLDPIEGLLKRLIGPPQDDSSD